jgi:hypothetical protein
MLRRMSSRSCVSYGRTALYSLHALLSGMYAPSLKIVCTVHGVSRTAEGRASVIVPQCGSMCTVELDYNVMKSEILSCYKQVSL